MARIRPHNLTEQLNTVGDFIAAQRRTAELSLRQLAEQAGISNPYLSQIERGLRRPSAEVLQQLSRALRVSAETLYVRAGILDPEDHRATTVEMAVLADPGISERQKQVLVEIYASFLRENERNARDADAAGPLDESAPTDTVDVGLVDADARDVNARDAVAGDAAAGSATPAPTGTAPAGTAPAGTAPAGTAPAGTAPAGTAAAGTAAAGTAAAGSAAAGSAAQAPGEPTDQHADRPVG